MKYYILSLLFILGFSVKKKNTLIRTQGYLLIERSPIDLADDDIVVNYSANMYFAPLSDINSLVNTIDSLDISSKKSLFLPVGLTTSNDDLYILNLSIKKWFNNKIKVKELPEYNSFQKAKKTVIKQKKSNRYFQIIYIDGLWSCLHIKSSHAEALMMDNFRINSLLIGDNINSDIYFLEKIKVISYDLKIDEKDIEVLSP